jgi:hypothetical protein
MESNPLLHRPLLAYCTGPGWWVWSKKWNAWQGKPSYSENTCPCATLSTTNPTLRDPDRRGGKPATNRLTYGTVSLSDFTVGFSFQPWRRKKDIAPKYLTSSYVQNVRIQNAVLFIQCSVHKDPPRESYNTLYSSGIQPFLFAYPQIYFLFNFVPTKLLVYNSSYTQSIICI